jgi:hypothetical protein
MFNADLDSSKPVRFSSLYNSFSQNRSSDTPLSPKGPWRSFGASVKWTENIDVEFFLILKDHPKFANILYNVRGLLDQFWPPVEQVTPLLHVYTVYVHYTLTFTAL